MSGWKQSDVDAYNERLKRDPEGVADTTLRKSRQLGVTPVLCPTLDTIVLEFQGKVPSKKNRYTPRKDGKGFFKDSKLQSELDAIALQIPGNLRDINLESPEVHFFFRYSGKANWDRDNACTAMIDLLVEYGVFKGDQVRRFNGKLVIHPAEKDEYDSVRVVIHPR